MPKHVSFNAVLFDVCRADDPVAAPFWASVMCFSACEVGRFWGKVEHWCSPKSWKTNCLLVEDTYSHTYFLLVYTCCRSFLEHTCKRYKYLETLCLSTQRLLVYMSCPYVYVMSLCICQGSMLAEGLQREVFPKGFMLAHWTLKLLKRLGEAHP